MSTAVTAWKAQLDAESYKHAARKWLVGRGHEGHAGGILAAFAADGVEPQDWVTELRGMDGAALGALVARVEAEAARKAESAAQMLPLEKKGGRRLRRGSINLSLTRMSSASPRAEIRGVGQQLFDVKLGRKSLQLGVSQMSLTLFKPDNSPLRTILYQKIASVESDGARLTVRTDDGAVENLSSKHAAALSAAIQAHLDVGTPK